MWVGSSVNHVAYLQVHFCASHQWLIAPLPAHAHCLYVAFLILLPEGQYGCSALHALTMACTLVGEIGGSNKLPPVVCC